MQRDTPAAMLTLFIACSVSAAMTSVFAFRYRDEWTAWALVRYFVLFAVLEWAGERFVLGGDGLGIEVGLVSLVIAGVFVAATFVQGWLESS